jgi:hypothetical protein
MASVFLFKKLINARNDLEILVVLLRLRVTTFQKQQFRIVESNTKIRKIPRKNVMSKNVAIER